MQKALLRRAALGAGVLLAVGASTAAAADNSYVQTNLVSDIPGLAQATDPNLVNPWGLSALPTSPVWASDNGTGVSTLYAGHTPTVPGAVIVPLVVTIPNGLPTGTVSNPNLDPAGTDFVVSDGTTSGAARFLFASLTGTISGWAPTVGIPAGGTPPSTVAQVITVTPGAVYTGLAAALTGHGARLYAADFAQGKIDVWDGSFTPAGMPGGFTDRKLPAGYHPFNVQVIGKRVFVAYALVDPATGRDDPGASHGFVDAYTLQGRLVSRLIMRDHLNSPWGLVRAPANFGAFGGDLLVGNFGNGRIHAYDIHTGEFMGVLQDQSGSAIVNDGLWGLRFGNGTIGTKHSLIFAAGIQDETHGLLGAIDAS